MQDFTKMFDIEKVSGMYSVEGLKNASEKNIRNCKKASDIVMESMTKYSKRQTEIAKECVDASIEAIKDISEAKSVEEFSAKQKAIVEGMIARNTNIVKELTEMMQDSQSKLSEIAKEFTKLK